MKSTLLTLFAITAFSLAQAQCDANANAKNCVPMMANGYTLIKSFEIDGESGSKEKVEYSYVFTKGTKYLINVCGNDGTPDGVIVTVYDKYRNQVASSKVNGTAAQAIAVTCRATGIYYLTYTFNKSVGHCAGSNVGFKRLS